MLVPGRLRPKHAQDACIHTQASCIHIVCTHTSSESQPNSERRIVYELLKTRLSCTSMEVHLLVIVSNLYGLSHSTHTVAQFPSNWSIVDLQITHTQTHKHPSCMQVTQSSRRCWADRTDVKIMHANEEALLVGIPRPRVLRQPCLLRCPVHSPHA